MGDLSAGVSPVPDHDPAVIDVLEEARDLGFLGPGPVGVHIDHAHGFAAAAEPLCPGRVVDLGSGGGVPGLVLAMTWPTADVALVDSSERRTVFLGRAVERLGLGPRVSVVRARAEDLGRDRRWRGRADAVVARGFGPPAVVAECGAPLLRVGGRLIVSEPPSPRGDRWPVSGLAQLGLGVHGVVSGETASMAVLVQERPCPPAFPRPSGRPAKRPLFGP